VKGFREMFQYSNRRWLCRVLWMVIAISPFLSGCQGSLFNVQGQTLQYQDRIMLKTGGEQSGKYKTDELTVDYVYVRKGDDLTISGTVRFNYSMQGNFSTVNTFSLALVLADTRGTILAQQGLTTAYDHSVTDPITFKTTMIIPYQTEIMSFSYTGASSGAGTSGSPSAFWHNPAAQ
jgi:hypothetical protein